MNLLGDLGGFQTCIFVIGQIIVSYFSTKFFYSDIIKKIYQADIAHSHLNVGMKEQKRR